MLNLIAAYYNTSNNKTQKTAHYQSKEKIFRNFLSTFILTCVPQTSKAIYFEVLTLISKYFLTFSLMRKNAHASYYYFAKNFEVQNKFIDFVLPS